MKLGRVQIHHRVSVIQYSPTLPIATSVLMVAILQLTHIISSMSSWEHLFVHLNLWGASVQMHFLINPAQLIASSCYPAGFTQ